MHPQLERHPIINLYNAIKEIRKDHPNAEILTLTLFDKEYTMTPDDVAEIEIQCNTPNYNRAIYGVTLTGHVTCYAN